MSYDRDPFAPAAHHQNSDSMAFNPNNSTSTTFSQHQRNASTYKDGGDGLNETFQPGAVREVRSGAGAGGIGGIGGKEDDFDPFQPPPKSTGDLRMWRHDHHGNLWTKGGRGRCFGRFCCCSVMTVLLLFVSIILTLALFLRPPDIEFSGIAPSTTGSAVTASQTDLSVNLGIGIKVKNPNFFAVVFKSIKASVTYPINNVEIGGGEQDSITFKSNSETSFTFPFTIKYSETADPDRAILKDIASRCGFLPGSVKKQLSVNYDLKLAIRVIFFTISPPISGTADFDCPFTEDEIKPLLSSIPGLAGLLR